MKALLQPWQLLLLILAGRINRRQQDAVEHLLTENRVLRAKLGKKRILLNDDERRRLAVKGKILGRKMLEQLATIVTPETILRWHRELVAAHWDYSKRWKSVGRPPVSQEIVELVLRVAMENSTWGYDRIQGALANLGRRISDKTVGNILIAGCTANPDELWMLQIGRNLSDAGDGFLRGKKFLVMDRDAKFSEAFRVTLEQEGVKAVRLPPRSPNLTPEFLYLTPQEHRVWYAYNLD